MLWLNRYVEVTFMLFVGGGVVGFVSAEFAAKAWVQGSPPAAIALYALSVLGLLVLGLAIRDILTFLVALVMVIAAEFIPPLKRYLDRQSGLRRTSGA
ncbi:MAG: hypothetical protein Q8R32_03760 [bacterium]|nr:hypothetical protein [bacterium]